MIDDINDITSSLAPYAEALCSLFEEDINTEEM
jgi:hypothetical protein